MKTTQRLLLCAACLLLSYTLQAQSPWLEFNDASGNFYNYCPSYVEVSATERYIYYCKNLESGNIRDYIYWRKATKSGSTWTWGAQQIALSPGNGGTWDMIHVCDPDVKKGSFAYNGHTYTWIMFYLGTDVWNNTHNQIGLAFADSPAGPWVRYGGNPIITAPADQYWGVGQLSATSVGGAGRLLLFYTRGNAASSRIWRVDANLGNMSSYTLSAENPVPLTGLTKRDGSPADFFHNAGFAYDGSTDRFYTVREREPYDSGSDFVSTETQVAYMSGAGIWNNNGTWTVDGNITPSVSGKGRNHNSGFLTDAWGGLTGGSGNYQVAFTGSDASNLWSYRIYSVPKSGLTNTNSTPTGPANNAIYELEPQCAVGKRLDVAGAVDANGTNVHSWEANNNSAQRWRTVSVGNGYFELIPQCATTRRLDVSGAGTADGTNVNIWIANNNFAQHWKFISVGGDIYELEPRNAPGKRLDVSSSSTANGANVHIWTGNSSSAQRWKLIFKSAARLAAPGSVGETTQLNVYPNPATERITIQYQPSLTESISLHLFDSQGKMVQRVFEGRSQAGVSEVYHADGTALKPGFYVLRLTTPSNSLHHKLIVAK